MFPFYFILVLFLIMAFQELWNLSAEGGGNAPGMW